MYQKKKKFNHDSKRKKILLTITDSDEYQMMVQHSIPFFSFSKPSHRFDVVFFIFRVVKCQARKSGQNFRFSRRELYLTTWVELEQLLGPGRGYQARARWQLTEIQSFPLDLSWDWTMMAMVTSSSSCLKASVGYWVHQFPPMQNYSSRAAVEQLSGMSGNKQEINLLKLP